MKIRLSIANSDYRLMRCRLSFPSIMPHVTPLIWFALALVSVGCVPQSQRTDHPGDRPFVEPTHADRPDEDAIALVARDIRISGDEKRTQHSAWPSLFGTERTSVTDAKLNPIWPADGPELLWETEVGTGYGSPVAADGRVVFNSRTEDEEIVQCHDVVTGKLLWKYHYPTSAVCDFQYSDGPYSTPVIDIETRRVFNVGGQGQFACLDLDTGEVVWGRDLHTEFDVSADIFPVGASPLLDRDTRRAGGQLIFNLGAYHCDAGVISIDPATGQTLWCATDHGPSYGTPFVTTIHGERFAFVLTDEGLVSLDPDQGSVDWTYPYRRKGDLARNATSPLVADDKVIVVSAGLGAACLQIQTDRSFKKLWRQRRSIDSQYNTLILGQRHFYSFTSGGQGGAEFRCIELETGEVAWRYHSLLKRGMGLATSDAIVLLGERGHLASLAFSPESPRVLSFTEQPLMSMACYCSPAVHGSSLILKDEKRVAVFDLTW